VNIDDHSPFGKYILGTIAKYFWRMAGNSMVAKLRNTAFWKSIPDAYSGPFDVCISGIKLRIFPRENYGDRFIAITGRFSEESELRLLKPALERAMVFVDIGANMGIYSLYAADCMRDDAVIVAIEANPETHRKLKFNINANGAQNIRPVAKAVAALSGEMQFWPDRGKNTGRSSIIREAVGQPGEPIMVSTQTLQEIIGQSGIDHIDVVKIDIEGYEDCALLPYLEAEPKSNWPGTILLETAHRNLWQRDVLTVAQTMGYSITAETPDNVLLSLDDI